MQGFYTCDLCIQRKCEFLFEVFIYHLTLSVESLVTIIQVAFFFLTRYDLALDTGHPKHTDKY